MIGEIAVNVIPGTQTPPLSTAYESEERRLQEKTSIARFFNRVKNRTAVTGLARVLDALEKGRLQTLIVRDGYAKMGHRCGSCGKLSLLWEKCPACQQSMETVFNIVEEMVHKVLDGGREVVRLSNESPLDNLGKIGAELASDGERPH